MDCRKGLGAGGIDNGEALRGGEPQEGCEFLLEFI